MIRMADCKYANANRGVEGNVYALCLAQSLPLPHLIYEPHDEVYWDGLTWKLSVLSLKLASNCSLQWKLKRLLLNIFSGLYAFWGRFQNVYSKCNDTLSPPFFFKAEQRLNCVRLQPLKKKKVLCTAHFFWEPPYCTVGQLQTSIASVV